MPATTQVKVIVDAQDNASKVLGGLKTQLSGLAKSADNLGKDLKTVGKIALAGATGLLALGVKAGMTAARVEELGFALNAIAKANNISQEAVDGTVQSLRDMNIAHAKALQVTSLFIQSQLDLADATKIATAAKDLAVVAGLDSSEATETLTNAIVMQRPMLLRQFGIVKGLEQIYGDYAKSLNKGTSEIVVNTKKTAANEAKLSKLKDQLTVANLRVGEFTDKTKESTKVAAKMRVDRLTEQIGALDGKTTAYTKTGDKMIKNLTEQQKRQAFLNAILEAGGKVAGTYDAAMDSVSKRFRSLTGRIIPDFMAKIGKAFQPALVVIIDAISKAIKDMSIWIDNNKDMIADWGEKLGEVAVKGIEFLGKMFKFLIENKEIIVGVLVAIGVAVGILVGSFVVAHAAVVVVLTAIAAAVAFLLRAWKENFWGIGEKIKEFIASVSEMKDNVISWIIEMVTKVIEWFTFLPERIEKIIGDFIYTWIPYAFGFLLGFIIGTIADMTTKVIYFFVNWKENLKKIVQAFLNFWKTSYEFWKNFTIDLVKGLFNFFKEAIKTSFDNTIGSATHFVKNFDSILSGWKDRVKEVVDKVKGFFQHLIDKVKEAARAVAEGFRGGMRAAGIPGFQTGGVVPGPVGAPVPAVVHGGEKVIPAGVDQAEGGGGGITLNVSIGLYAGTETEKRNIARDLYSSLVQVAQSQNKSVREMLGA